MSEGDGSPKMTTEAKDLRAEVIASQNQIFDLIKWKLMSVSILCASAFGLSNGNVNIRIAPYILCAAPLVAVFCDFLCLQIALRVGVIGAFLRRTDAYEEHVASVRARGVFHIETGITVTSTAILSGGTIIYPFLVDSAIKPWPFFVFGFLGILGVLVWTMFFSWSFSHLEEVEREIASAESQSLSSPRVTTTGTPQATALFLFIILILLGVVIAILTDSLCLPSRH